jgi:hypothetical protein
MLNIDEMIAEMEKSGIGIWPHNHEHPSRSLQGMLENGIRGKKKVFIGIGCSFVEGQNAFDDDMFDRFPPEYDNLAYTFKNYSLNERAHIVQSYDNLDLWFCEDDYDIICSNMMSENAFTNQICKHHLKDYYPINFGARGNGNKASISRLFLYNLPWEECDDIIVNVCLSGIARYDHLLDAFGDHYDGTPSPTHRTSWPNKWDEESQKENGWRALEDGYRRSLHSEKEEVLRCIMDMAHLQAWCERYNAKLVVTHGFEYFSYTKERFRQALSKLYRRSFDSKIEAVTTIQERIDSFLPEQKRHLKLYSELQQIVERQVDMFPWDKVVKLRGYEDFISLALSNEEGEMYRADGAMYAIVESGVETPNRWVLRCGHPSAKAHKLYADALYEELQRMNYV